MSDGPIDEPWLPGEVKEAWRKAKVNAWLSIGYLLTVVVAMAVVRNSSQAMKSAWLDDALALIPPASFLLSSRFTHRRATSRFPYGYHRAASVAFLTGALALVGAGLYLVVDGVARLIAHDHVRIGATHVAGHPVWMGWLMLLVLVWSAVPAMLLGRAKRPLAQVLHDKALLAAADMNRADWIAAAAAAVGVIGAGAGWWWLDAVAGAAIGVEITRDGAVKLVRAVHDLMDREPEGMDGDGDPLPRRIERELERVSWIRTARVRLREQGHVLVGEVVVVPAQTDGLLEHLTQLRGRLLALDWRLQDLVIAPVATLDDSMGPHASSHA